MYRQHPPRGDMKIKMDAQTKDNVVNRLARAEGHLAKVRSMLEEGAYCPDVIHQSQAVQGALKKVDEIVLQSHLHSCVLKDIKGSRAKKKEMINEIVEVFKKQK